ncbi:MAG: 6,7-dimethyl-8-ribityllumazine synthase [Fimbriimonadales bacterium]|nr:MAG: 6,7-dimethyl-8-ribityllumazine synthase [Fimbriimonadales bacterium]
MSHFEGALSATGLRFAIVVSRYNELITDRLKEGAIQTLLRHGADPNAIDTYAVPGSWEIPLIARECAQSGEYDAVICLGAVLQGETSHAQHISSAVCSALMQIMLETGKPIALGVLTDATFEQGLARAGGKMGNKGSEAALSAIEMANLLRTTGESL